MVEKDEVVKCLRLANALWAIEGANPYSVKAHERSAQAILDSPMGLSEILALPPGTISGVGKETLAMVQALQDGGLPALLHRLSIDIPVSAAELLRLPGIGPKTAHMLIHQHHVESAEGLVDALENGKIGHVPGLGMSRLARLKRDLKVFLENKGLIPIGVAYRMAMQLKELWQHIPGVDKVSFAGELRRRAVQVPRLDFVIQSSDTGVLRKWMESFQPQITDIAEGITVAEFNIASVSDSFPVRLEVTSHMQYASVLMMATGGETHTGVMQGLLREQGWELTNSGILHQVDDISLVKPDAAPRDEVDIYGLVGLPYFPPELREGRGILQNPTRLLKQGAIRGDLHVHSTWSDGTLSIAEIVERAEQLGYEYVAITDHSQSLSIANGLNPIRLRAQANEIAQVQRHTRVRILHGIEVDILADGRLDLPDEALAQLDFVIASVHSAMHQSKDEMTERILRAIEHPYVRIIGHLSGRMIGRRAAYLLDFDTLFQAAIKHGVMFELNANPNRLDIHEDWLRMAKQAGMRVPINTDAHAHHEFDYMEYGIHMAWRGWLYDEDVLNTLPLNELQQVLKKNGLKQPAAPQPGVDQ